ncbi:MAG: peptide ABC transporter substrate-binding protein [Chloroflexi bacterium]|nr:peptide ABC transporter substrate-binding protein [Chloroflexota bacterium]
MLPQLKSKVWTVFTILIVCIMLLTACGQAATQAPANTPMPIPPTYTPMSDSGPTQAPPTQPAAAPTGAIVNAWGVALPADAAPLDQQIVRIQAPEGITVDFAVSVYKRSANSNSDLLSTSFVIIDKNFALIPAGALTWDVSADGMTWTFHMDPKLTWSSGNPVTADDVVFTFQYQADPKHAWDFTWFWGDITNWDKAVKGEVPTSEIGVKKVDDFTVQFTTTAPSPYFPSKALYIRPMSKIAFEKNGEFYNNTPETSVSSSPWILTEWTKGKGMSFGPNKNYTGKFKPFIEKIIFTFSELSNEFRAYQNGEVDSATTFTPADIALISSDPQLSKEYHPGYGDFRTFYLGFNTYEKPFNDLKVRQAFAKAIDRDSIIKNIVNRQGNAAYSFLMPGFPGANSEELKAMDVNKYDVAAAKALLAEAGYPDGKGFPSIELWTRNETDVNKAIAAAIASMLQQNLGINIEVSNKEAKLFMDTLNAHKLPFYFLSYGFDYLDQSNMLGIWTSNGRHAWKNAEFDKLVTDASSLVGDNAKRDQMFKDAEKILVSDVGGIFIYHVTPGGIYKSYMKGTELDADKTGVAAWHWPFIESGGMLVYTLYVSNEAPASRK